MNENATRRRATLKFWFIPHGPCGSSSPIELCGCFVNDCGSHLENYRELCAENNVLEKIGRITNDAIALYGDIYEIEIMPWALVSKRV